jgi:hypothetical protein
MLAPTAVEEVAGAAVGETLSTVTPEVIIRPVPNIFNWVGVY